MYNGIDPRPLRPTRLTQSKAPRGPYCVWIGIVILRKARDLSKVSSRPKIEQDNEQDLKAEQLTGESFHLNLSPHCAAHQGRDRWQVTGQADHEQAQWLIPRLSTKSL